MDENEEFEFRRRAELEHVAGSPREPPKKYDPTEGMSGGQKFLAGAGKAFVDLGRGVNQAGAELGEKVGLVSPETVRGIQSDVDESKRLDSPLMQRGAGRAGNIVGNVAALAPAAAIPGVNTALGAAALGGATGALQPVASDESRLRNTVTGAAAGVAGKALGDVASKGVGFIADKLGRIRPATVATEAGKMMEKGYVLPPSYAKIAGAKPSALDEMLEGFGGKIKTEQKFSLANQENTNRLVRRALGLKEGEAITAERLGQLRADAGEVYETVKSYRGGFTPDEAFQRGMEKISKTATTASTKARGKLLQGPKEITELVESLKSPEALHPEEAVELVKKLRLDGKANFRGQADQKALGRAQLKAADEIDGLISRTLAKDKEASGLFKAYKEARVLIAKSYDVEKALNKGTGNVSAQKLARIAEKSKMSGEMADVVDFARKFEGISRTVEQRGSRLGPEHSPLDYAAAGVMALHHPAAGLAFMGRPLARRYMLSQSAQRRMLPTAAPTLEQQALPRAGEIIAPQMLSSYRQEE